MCSQPHSPLPTSPFSRPSSSLSEPVQKMCLGPSHLHLHQAFTALSPYQQEPAVLLLVENVPTSKATAATFVQATVICSRT